ncbi:MAG: helix-turn-helix domain-containing protein [Bacteroidota bacterium]
MAEFRSDCLISSMLDILGDKWSLLIVRDMLLKHKKTFKEISESKERIAPSVLSSRLKLLESWHLIRKTKSPANKKENIYLLTEKGIDLAPILTEYSLWSHKHLRSVTDLEDLVEGLDTNTAAVTAYVMDQYRAMARQFT